MQCPAIFNLLLRNLFDSLGRQPYRVILLTLSFHEISERELSWCLVAVSVDFLVTMEILSWQIPTFALNEGAHLPLVPTRPHHVEVRKGFHDPIYIPISSRFIYSKIDGRDM